jgi:putative Mg2+ transporter-C (MgtC) family protein
MDFLSINWRIVLDDIIRIGAAYVLALPVAWERERGDTSAGLRTFPLVAVASAGFVLTGVRLEGSTAEGVSRIIQGLMTGIGFIGGGTILKQQDRSVHGTATAASIWSTGAIGAAAALSRFDVAIVLSVATFATLRLLKPLKKSLRRKPDPPRSKEVSGERRAAEDDDYTSPKQGAGADAGASERPRGRLVKGSTRPLP